METTAPLRLVVAGPKGGIGKTTLSRNLAVAAAAEGLRVATLDLDPQRSLTNWYSKRPDKCVQFDHFKGDMNESTIREAMAAISEEGYDLLVVDTPPSVEDSPEGFKALAAVADLLLIPTSHTDDDLEVVRPWMRFVRSLGRPAAYVMNRVNARARAFVDAKAQLVDDGPLCPIEIPSYEDVPFTFGKGIGLVELKNGKGSEYIAGVWAYVRAELRGRRA